MTLFLGATGNSDLVLSNHSFGASKREAWEMRKLLLPGLQRFLKEAFIMAFQTIFKTLVLEVAQVVKHVEFIDWGRTAWNIDTAHSFVSSPVATHWQARSRKHQRAKTWISERLYCEYGNHLQVSCGWRTRLPSCYFIHSGAPWVCLLNAAPARGHNDNSHLLRASQAADTILSTFQIFKTIREVGIILYR